MPLRIQHRSGGLWMLNSAALAALGAADQWPDGRLFRADRWLRERMAASDPPALGPATDQLLAVGITGFTDAGADNGIRGRRPSSRRHIARACFPNVSVSWGAPSWPEPSENSCSTSLACRRLLSWWLPFVPLTR